MKNICRRRPPPRHTAAAAGGGGGGGGRRGGGGGGGGSECRAAVPGDPAAPPAGISIPPHPPPEGPTRSRVAPAGPAALRARGRAGPVERQCRPSPAGPDGTCRFGTFLFVPIRSAPKSERFGTLRQSKQSTTETASRRKTEPAAAAQQPQQGVWGGGGGFGNGSAGVYPGRAGPPGPGSALAHLTVRPRSDPSHYPSPVVRALCPAATRLDWGVYAEKHIAHTRAHAHAQNARARTGEGAGEGSGREGGERWGERRRRKRGDERRGRKRGLRERKRGAEEGGKKEGQRREAGEGGGREWGGRWGERSR